MKTLSSILFINLFLLSVPFSSLLAQDSIRFSGRVIFEHPPNESLFLTITSPGHQASELPYNGPGNFEVTLPNMGFYQVELFQTVFVEDSVFRIVNLRDTLASFCASLEDTTIIIHNSAPLDSIKAQLDIRRGKPKLFAIGGIAPVVTIIQTEDGSKIDGNQFFEEKYGASIYIFGDAVTFSRLELLEYNKVVMTYLDQEFGRGWRKWAHPQIIME